MRRALGLLATVALLAGAAAADPIEGTTPEPRSGTMLSALAPMLAKWIETSRDAAIAASALPSIQVMTVSEAADRLELPAVASIPVTVEDAPGAGRRPGGARFGTLVHAILADVPLADPSPGLIAKLATAHARVLGAIPEELEIAIETVGRVLEHPILERATRAALIGRCYRETPITYRTDASAVVEGVVDLAFEEESGFTVVDFKTDRTLELLEAGYRRQVQIYAAAIAAATGKPANGVLMRIV